MINATPQEEDLDETLDEARADRRDSQTRISPAEEVMRNRGETDRGHVSASLEGSASTLRSRRTSVSMLLTMPVGPREAANDSGLLDALKRQFPHAHAATLTSIAAEARLRHASAGHIVVGQGDPQALVLLLAGVAVPKRKTRDGRESIASIETTVGFVTIQPFNGQPVTADIVAVTDCRIAVWQGEAFRAHAIRDAGLAVDLVDLVLSWFSSTIAHQDELVSQEAVPRVARVLRRNGDLFFGVPPVLTTRHLPAMVGTSREMTSRVLRRLQQQGVISRDAHGRLGLLDPVRLVELARD